jgi:Uma2 family endonuclease
MAMPLPLPTYTTDDLRAFPHDGCRYELLDGMLLVTPAPGSPHQLVISRLHVALANYIGDPGPAWVASPGEIEIAPKTLLDPDLLVCPTRFRAGTPWTKVSGWWLAVEVFSRSSKRYDRDFKRDTYLALGVREVWLVDKLEKAIFVSKPGTPKDVRRTGRFTWRPEELPEPLTIDCARVFRGLP